MTATDALVVNGAGLAAAASVIWERVRDRLSGRTGLDREMRTWSANAEFVASMGLDPVEVLGVPPAVPGHLIGDAAPGSACPAPVDAAAPTPDPALVDA